MDACFVYTLADPRDLNLFPQYVGIAHNLNSRYKGHISHDYANPNSKWIRSLYKKGVKVVMEVLEEIHYEDFKSIEDAERFWISYLRFLGFKLRNSESGGRSGRRWSPEARKRYSEKCKGKKFSALALERSKATDPVDNLC